MNERSAILYLFPVPMGDTKPIDVLPYVNIEIIRQIKYFIVENTRSARRFLKACDKSIDINTISIVELNEHTPACDVEGMLDPIQQGNDIGIISEAGCPAVADPGADAVAIAQRKGYKVVPLVGPSSIILSLMASGFNGQSFAFNGYLPIDTGARIAKAKEMDQRIRREHQTQIFIETPYRNNKLIKWICSTFSSDLRLCVASDITGSRESIVTMPIREWKETQYNYDKVPTIFLLYL